MPVQILSHRKSIRPLKIVSTLQSIPELPEDSGLTSMGASTSVERHNKLQACRTVSQIKLTENLTTNRYDNP